MFRKQKLFVICLIFALSNSPPGYRRKSSFTRFAAMKFSGVGFRAYTVGSYWLEL